MQTVVMTGTCLESLRVSQAACASHCVQAVEGLLAISDFRRRQIYQVSHQAHIQSAARNTHRTLVLFFSKEWHIQYLLAQTPICVLNLLLCTMVNKWVRDQGAFHSQIGTQSS